MQEFLNQDILQNPVSEYLISLGTCLLGILIVKVCQKIVIRQIKRWASQTRSQLDDDLISLSQKSLKPLVYLGVFYVSIRNLTLSASLDTAIDAIGVIVLTVLIIHFLGSLAEYGIRLYWITHRTKNPNLELTLRSLIPATKVVLWAFGMVFLLDNFGFDISAIVAGLGIGGVAVALASQGLLQDLFSYFSILLDRPFELGDFIVVDDFMGTVEYIGIKTTHIRSISGEQIILSNTDLTGSRIRNFMRMQKRRVVFSIGVTYQTGRSKLQEIPTLLQEIIESTEHTIFDRAHFQGFGDFSLNFEVVYFVTSSDYNLYMDIQQSINLAMMATFAQRDIEFAYPTQVTYLNDDSGKELVATH